MPTTYRDRLTEAMTWASTQHHAVFLGQAIAFPGTAMTATFAHVPDHQLIEMPVAEDLQLGMSIGLSLQSGRPVVSVFPRINFMMCCMSQLVLHLDALPRYSDGGFVPHVIIRTAVATDTPLNPGEQHIGDFSAELRSILKTIHVERLNHSSKIIPAYKDALLRKGSSLLIEFSEMYDNE